MKICLALIILLVGGAFLLWHDRSVTPELPANLPESPPPASTALMDGPVLSAAETEIEPVSLSALMAKAYNGRDLAFGRVLERNSAYTRYFITYKSGELTISGIANIPTGPGPFPVLLLNHGFIDPAIYTNGRGLKREQDYLARRGYAVFHSDYRNHAESDDDPENELNFRLGYTEDIINLIVAIQATDRPELDTEHIGMLGHSMGGGVTLNTLVVKPELVQVAVLFAPVSANYERNYERWTKQDSETGKKIIERYGTPEENPKLWNGVSAKNYFDRIVTPIQNHHGTLDKDVEVQWSDELRDWLEQAGKDLEYHVYPGEPHEFAVAWPTVMDRTVKFFDTHLKSKTP